MAMQIECAEIEGKRLIKVRGEVDLSTSPDLRRSVLEAINSGQKTVGIDLSEVKYMDSSGVATLIEGLRAAGRSKAKYIVVAPSKPVRDVFQLTKLDTVFDLRDTF
jgi:anti-sigma B factor antagonist